MRRAAGVLLLLLTAWRPAVAQANEPPGPYVVDLRGTMAGLPDSAAFAPDVPPQAVVPARAFGLETGAHVYPLRVGGARLGVGGSLLWARGTATPPKSPGTTGTGSSPRTTAGLPDIRSRLLSWSPQVSVNFGRREGWSYLSAGVGRSALRAEATTGSTTAERSIEPIATLNVGGGARWFTRDRLAVGFDVRFYRLSATTAAVPAAATAAGSSGSEPPAAGRTTITTPRTTLFVISVGVGPR